MQAGIVGLPNVGKSTLFNALTAAGAQAANYPFCTIEPNVGVLVVPDPRLEQIHSVVATKQILPATVEIVDIAGLVRGASQGEGLGNQFLSHIRNIDAILHVVRCFEDSNVTHVEGSVNPLRDIDTIDTELILADLAAAQKRVDRYRKLSKGGDKEALFHFNVAEKLLALLDQGKPARAESWSEAELESIRDAQLITSKRTLYVCNVDENQITGGDNKHVAAVKERAKADGSRVVVLCTKVEAEVAELPLEERAAFLVELGIPEPGLAVLARETYHLLGLQTYFTAGPKEIRAWTVRVGAKGPEAAAVIHSDFERLFIRAEVYRIEDLLAAGGEAALKTQGKMRVEGKEYVVQDGDVVHFLIGR